ncbi:hypothetical protein Tco_1221466 [Tanacetum coccineum]
MATIKYMILPKASRRGPTMSIHFWMGQAEVTEIMSFLAALVRSPTPDMSHGLISRCWHPDAYLARSIWPAVDLCIKAVAPGRISFSIYSWMGVIQVLVASSIIALTSAVSTNRSLSSSTSTPVVSPSYCTVASLLKASAFDVLSCSVPDQMEFRGKKGVEH